jgi:hypothetical protein
MLSIKIHSNIIIFYLRLYYVLIITPSIVMCITVTEVTISIILWVNYKRIYMRYYMDYIIYYYNDIL